MKLGHESDGKPWYRFFNRSVSVEKLLKLRAEGAALPLMEPLEPRFLLSVPSTWSPVGVGATGAIYAPTVSPINSSEIVAGTDMGEYFHTTSVGGTGWDIFDTRQLSSAGALSKVSITSLSGLLYSSGRAADGYTTVPVMSTDDGATWSILTGWTYGGVEQVLADPSSTSASTTKIIATTSHSASASPGDWSVRFSGDGGATWSVITSGTNDYCWLAGAFFDGNNIYVATSHGLKISTNGGSTWSDGVTTGLNMDTDAMWSFGGAKTGSTTRLWAILWPKANCKPGNLVTTQSNGHFMAIDWTMLATVDYDGSSSWVNKKSMCPATEYYSWIATIPGDINKLYLGGGETTQGGPAVRYINDGGTTFGVNEFIITNNQNINTACFGWGGDLTWGWAGPVFGIAAGANDPDRVVITNTGGIWDTSSGTSGANGQWYASFVPRAQCTAAGSQTGVGVNSSGVVGKTYSSSLNETLVWDINWIDKNDIVAGAADVTSITSNDGGVTWHYNYYQSRLNTLYNSVTDTASGIVYAAANREHGMYIMPGTYNDSTYAGQTQCYVYYSPDKGNTWNILHNFGTGHAVRTVAIDPRHPDRLYALLSYHDQDSVPDDGNWGGIWMTDDVQDGASATWTQLPIPDPATCSLHGLDLKILNDGVMVCVYGGRAVGSTYQDQSGVFISTDGGTTWVRKATGGLRYMSADITIDPSDQNIWYVAGYNAVGVLGGLWKYNYSTDVWTQLLSASGQYGGTGDFFYSATCSPTTNEMYVAGQTTGLWYTPDRTAATPVFYRVPGLKFGAITMMKYNPYNPDELWVATYGNGIYIGNTRDVGAPAPVSKLTVADVPAPDKIRLTWTINNVPFGDGFKVERSTDGTTWSLLDTIDSGTATSYMATGLSANTTYYFRVKSFTAAGDSASSNVVSAKTLVSSIIASDGFNYTGNPGASWNGGSGFSGNWTSTAPSDVTAPTGSLTPRTPANTLTTSGNKVQIMHGSKVTRSTSASFGADNSTMWYSYVFNLGGSGLFYGGVGLGSSTEAVGFGLANSGKYSFSITHNGAIVEAYASTSAPTSGTADLLVMRIDYKTTGGGDRVRLYLNPPAGASIPGDNYCILDVTLLNGHYIARGMTGVTLDDGTYSDTSQFDEFRIGSSYADVAPGTVTTPSAPGSFTATADGRKINLAWSDVTGEQGYKIYSKLHTDPTYALLETIYSPDLTSYVVTNLLNNQSYDFEVAAFNDAGTSSLSSSANATTDALTAPAAPTALSVSVTSTTQATISWSDSTADHTGFTLQYTDGSLDLLGRLIWTTVDVPTTSTGNFQQSVSNLKSNKSYVFNVYAYNAGGNSAVAGSGMVAALSAPTGLTLTTLGPTAVALQWTITAPSATGTSVEYSTDNSTWNVLTTVGAGISKASGTGLSANTQYYFRVRSTAVNSASDYGDYAVGRTSPTSTMSAYEPFYYDNGTINGDGGGMGWSGNWTTGAPAAATVASSSLSEDSLLTLGSHLHVTNQVSDLTRNMAGTVGADNTTLWASFVLDFQQAAAGRVTLLNASSQYIDFGIHPGNHVWCIINNNIDYRTDTNHTPQANTNYLVVMRIDYATTSGGDRMRLYINPAPGTSAPDVSTCFIDSTLASGHYVPRSFNKVRIESNGGGWTDQFNYDEIRIGATYADVTPTAPPTAGPTVLTANPASGTQVDLAWTNNASNNTGYHVYQSTDNVNWTLIQTLTSTTPTTCSATGLTASTVYYFRVSAYNTTGDSTFSNVASARTIGGSGAIAAPSNVQAVLTSPDRITLTWTNNATGSGIRISISTDGGSTYKPMVFINNGTATNYTLTNLALSTSYMFKVSSFNGTYTDSSAVTAATSAPSAPTGLTATAVSYSQIDLSWTDNANNESGYQIWYSNDPSAGDSSRWLLMATVGANTTSYSATNLFSYLTYYFRVKANNGAGTSAYAQASATTPASGLIIPVVTVSATDASAAETSSDPGMFTFSRDYTSGSLTVYYAVSGTATNGTDYTSISGSVTFSDGESTKTVTITPVDDAVQEGNETVILTLSANAAYTVGSPSSDTVTIIDNDTTVTIAATDTSAAETSSDPGVFTITRNYTNGALTVYYAVSGTATNGTDYTSIGTSVSFADGESTKTVTITPVDDAVQEGNETVILTLSANAAYTVGSPSSDTVTIIDNDTTVTIAATDASAAETSSDPGVFTITRNYTNGSLTVYYAVTGTATNGTDYTTMGSSVTFSNGEATKTVTITPTDDAVQEGNETVILTLSANAAYTVGSPSSDTVTIIDNDTTVTIAATDAEGWEFASDPGVFTITRNYTSGSLTVNYAVSGTATNGTDYTSIGTSVSFADGESTKTVTITPTDDASVEGNETAILTLSANAAYTVGSPSSATVTIADDTLIAYESFDYTAGADISGLNGGTGWGSSWSLSTPSGGSVHTIVSGSLAAASPANTLLTAANSYHQNHNAYATRTTANSFSVDATHTTLWVSCLFRPELVSGQSGGLKVGGLTINTNGGNYALMLNGTTPTQYLVGTQNGQAAQSDVPVLLVAEIIYGSPNDTFWLWVNPTPGITAPSTGSSVFSSAKNYSSAYFPTSSTVQMAEAPYTSDVGYDELRIGRSYADVAEDPPLVEYSNVSVGSTTKDTLSPSQDVRLEAAGALQDSGERESATVSGFTGGVPTHWAESRMIRYVTAVTETGAWVSVDSDDALAGTNRLNKRVSLGHGHIQAASASAGDRSVFVGSLLLEPDGRVGELI